MERAVTLLYCRSRPHLNAALFHGEREKEKRQIDCEWKTFSWTQNQHGAGHVGLLGHRNFAPFTEKAVWANDVLRKGYNCLLTLLGWCIWYQFAVLLFFCKRGGGAASLTIGQLFVWA